MAASVDLRTLAHLQARCVALVPGKSTLGSGKQQSVTRKQLSMLLRSGWWVDTSTLIRVRAVHNTLILA